MAETWYAWSTLYNGGEAKQIKDRKIIVSRNTVEPGEKVTKANLKADDATWDALVAGGSVRNYPFPKIPEGFSGSPSEFVMKSLRDGDGEIDQNTLLALALGTPSAAENDESELEKANS